MKNNVAIITGASQGIGRATAYAAVATINAAIVAMARAFADRGMIEA